MTDDTPNDSDASFTDLQDRDVGDFTVTVEADTREFSEEIERAKKAADAAGRATDELNRASLRSPLSLAKAAVKTAVTLPWLKWRLHRLSDSEVETNIRGPMDDQ